MAGFNVFKLRRLQVAAAAIATTVHILPRTVFIDEIKSIIQRYDRGIPVPLTPKIKELYNEVLDDLKLSEEVKQSLDPMFTPGSNPNYVGYILPKFESIKCLICIPETFEFEEPYDVPFTTQNWAQSIDLKSLDGKDCRDAFVLSKNAKKYAIAELIYEATSQLNYFYPTLSAFVIAHSFLFFGTPRFRTYLERFKWYKKGVYGVVALSFCSLYILLKDLCNLLIEQGAHEKISSLGQEYIEGGVEYLDKTLWQNRIARSTMPQYLKWMITEEGEPTQYFRWKHMSLSNRKQELEQLLLPNKS